MAAVKALQQWCRLRCDGYRDVSITNMTTSFRDGLAFCALIHKHRPDLIDFDSLRKENVYDNNKLAFRVAEEELGIPALLDAEDMVALKVPDRLSILTYVSQYYNYFHGRSPIGGLGGIKRPAEPPAEESSGKKNQPVTAKVFPSSKPARENSPPPSANITRPAASPKYPRKATQDAVVEKPHQTGTLSNKCVSCNKHVHLVQRQLVDGKLYHRSCAKLLAPTNTLAPLRDLHTNTPVSKFTALLDTKASTDTPSRLEPWQTEKPSPPSSLSSTFSTSASSISPAAKDTQTSSVSKPTPSWTSSLAAKDTQTSSVSKPTPSWMSSPAAKDTQTSSVSKLTPSWTSSPAVKDTQASSVSKFTPSRPASSLSPAAESTVTTTTSITPRPTPAPRTSTTAAKTQQSKLKFFQSDNTANPEEKKTTTINLDINKGRELTGKPAESHSVTVVVNVGGKSVNAGGEKAAAAGGDSGKVGESSKSKAAAFISKKLTEENNNNTSKPSWTNVALKKTEKPSQVETPKREPEGVRGRVKLKVDRSLLADLQTPDTTSSASSPASKTGLRARTPDRGAAKPRSASPNTSASENESPSDWRSKLKPVSKDTKPAAAAAQSSPKPSTNGAAKSQTSEVSVGPSPSPRITNLSISVTPPATKGFLNGQGDPTANGTKAESKVSKTKPDYISKDDIMKELQEIEDNLNELEKRGVELEMRLRSCEEEEEDDSLMDELMVEWFNLIRNKQVAMRRESELVYIGRTQDLEEQQPSVEQELRRLMDKPEHLKTSWERKREKELMDKLMEIVNDRNAIVEGLDEDRLREEEEDEQLNKMMKTFNIKKDKPKKKSPMSKLFSWGSKKEG